MLSYSHIIACMIGLYSILMSGASAAALPAKVPPLTIDGKPYLPFQLQIEYTAQDGSRNRRVITDAKPTTKEREVAERGISLVPSVHFLYRLIVQGLA